MTNTHKPRPDLSLCVQYAADAPQLPRWRLRRWVQGAIAAAKPAGVQNVTLTLRLVGQREARELNRTFRAKDYATNVLTFDYSEPACASTPQVLADIVICLPVVRQEARSMGKSFLEHAAHLVIHGTLHALGYDHIKAAQAKSLQALEVQALAGFGIENPYEI